jgi:hypothetical protein
VDVPVQTAVKSILAQYPTLVNANSGRSGADPFIIALAQANSCTVVTEEKSRPTKPKIPDVCAGFTIPCMNMLDLMLQQGWTYR